jgi:type II secretory pathway pseudopilin PulG
MAKDAASQNASQPELPWHVRFQIMQKRVDDELELIKAAMERVRLQNSRHPSNNPSRQTFKKPTYNQPKDTIWQS